MADRLLAVDPGKTSGVAYAEFTGAGVPEPETWELEHMATIALVEERLRGRGLACVACETFVPRPGVRTWEPDAIEIIGALRYVCWLHKTPFVLQTPANAKGFSTNPKLAKLGWRRPSAGGHADDALRHLLLLAVRGGSLDPDVFV